MRWRTAERHPIVSRRAHGPHTTHATVHAGMEAASSASTVTVMEAFPLDLGLNTLPIRSIANHRKDRSNDSDKFGSLTWLSIV